MNLDDKGRCCGRKPMTYKRPRHYLFCDRCNRAFNPTGEQVENWAWALRGEVWTPAATTWNSRSRT